MYQDKGENQEAKITTVRVTPWNRKESLSDKNQTIKMNGSDGYLARLPSSAENTQCKQNVFIYCFKSRLIFACLS
jgi:hypothetical protein